jgi:hypothetical protein
MKLNGPYFKQEKNTTCRVACLRMVPYLPRGIRQTIWLLLPYPLACIKRKELREIPEARKLGEEERAS